MDASMKYKVVHILPSFGMGGAERMAVHLMTHLDKHTFEVIAISLYARQGTDLERTLDEAGIKTYYLDKRPGMDLNMYPRLATALKTIQPDLAHSHLRVLRYTLPVYWQRRILAVHTVHNLANKEVNLLGQLVHHLAFRTKVSAVAIAEEVRESIQQLYKLGDIPLIPNAIPVEAYTHSEAKRHTWRQQQGFQEDDYLLVCIASMKAAKNQAMLIEAFSDYASRGNLVNTHLLLVGDGTLRPTLEKQAEGIGNIHFLGLREDIPDILSASDVFILPSLYEGNPLSVMEAMAAGKAIIATAVGGVPELIEHEKTGLLIPSGSKEALVKALYHLEANPELAKTMAYHASLEAQTSFAVSGMAHAYGKLYLSKLTNA